MAECGSDCKTGAEHLASLRDGRSVYIDGTLVDDVTIHPAFRNAVASATALYDFQARPENLEATPFMPASGGRRINGCWQKPRSCQELVDRRRALVCSYVRHHRVSAAQLAGRPSRFIERSPISGKIPRRR
jgi:aromatic ring hydroxylase